MNFRNYKLKTGHKKFLFSRESVSGNCCYIFVGIEWMVVDTLSNSSIVLRRLIHPVRCCLNSGAANWQPLRSHLPVSTATVMSQILCEAQGHERA